VNIVLIRTSEKLLMDPSIDPPFGLIVIGTILENRGHNVAIVDMNHTREIPEADIYGISVYTSSYHEALSAMKSIHGRPVIAGGPHATALPELLMKDGFDAVVTGECEGNICDIVECVHSGERGIFSGLPIDDLDTLPYWNYGLVDMSRYNRVVSGYHAFSYMTSRGCPNRCLFCWTAKNIVHKMRFHSVERVVNDLERSGNKYIRFFDDNFACDSNRLALLCNAIKRMGITYRCTPRVTDLTDYNCRMLSESGCSLVGLGIESGSDKMLKLMNKKQSTKQIMDGICNAKKYGIKVRIGLVLGFPGETWDTIKESVKFLMEVPFDEFNPYIFVPFPGTLPYHDPERFGITWLSNNWVDYHIMSGFNEPHIAFNTDSLNSDVLMDMWKYCVEKLSENRMLGVQDTYNR